MKKYLSVGFIIVACLSVCIVSAYAIEPLKFWSNVPKEPTFAIRKGYINNYVLTANVNTAVTVPSTAKYAIFAATYDIWVNISGVAAIPATDVTDGTGSELNPVIRRVEPNGTIGIISAYAAKVSISFFK